MTMRHPFCMFLLFLLFFLGNQAVTQGENKLPHAQYTLDAQDFYRFGKPNKITTRGADQRCPQPPNPPLLGD